MKKDFVLSAILFMVSAFSALAVNPGPEMTVQATFGDRGDDMCAPAFAHGRSDTIWYGGLDDDGLAKEGGLWDFDTDLHGDPFQGWTSREPTVDVGVRFGRVTAADFSGDPYAPIFPGSVGQLWVGIHEDEANLRDFICGMGYGNNQCQRGFSPEYDSYAGEAVGIRFKYFCNSEPDYDFTYVYILCYDEYDDLLEEYEVDYFDGISPGGDNLRVGNWETPQTYVGGVMAGQLHANTDKIQLELRFYSDCVWSDEDGEWCTPAGPFSADDIVVTVGGSTVGDYDFEIDDEGWKFDICAGIGVYMGVIPDAIYNDWMTAPPPAGAGLQCGCDMQGNALEFVDEENSPYTPPGHPIFHAELAMSNVVARGAGYYSPAYNTTILRYDAYYYLRFPAATFYRPGYMVYPFVTDVNPVPHWSGRRGQQVWQYSGDDPSCGLRHTNLSTLDGIVGDPIPQDWDSMRVCYEVHCSCEHFAIPPNVCNAYPYEGETVGAPVIDNWKVGLIGEVDAPPISFEFEGGQWHDGFGQDYPTYLEPCDVGNANATRDLSSYINAENDWHADTTGIAGPTVTPGHPEQRWWVEMHFKVVQKGARQDWIHGYHTWKARFDGDPETEFVVALMDSIEFCAGGHWVGWPNKFSTHFHELDLNGNGFLDAYPDGSQEQEILADGIWSPGTKIEYYYASFWYDNYPNPDPEQIFIYGPWEFEILPSMELDPTTPGEYDVRWPCVLYVDAYNRGVEYYINALLEKMGIAYDKFDYLDASSSWNCSMARDYGGTVYNPGGYGNNGCTLEQLLGYRLILFNTGTFGIGCTEEDDWVMFQAWLDNTSLGTDYRKGFIFDGDQICEIGEGFAPLFWANTLGVTLAPNGTSYRLYNDDWEPCVELSDAAGGEFNIYGRGVRLYGSGCPQTFNYNVLQVIGASGTVGNTNYYSYLDTGNQQYVSYAMVVREKIQTRVANWKTIVNGFSFHHISRIGCVVGEDCSSDSVCVVDGAADVLGPAIEWILEGTAPFDPWYKSPEDDAVEEGETHLAGAVNHLYMSRPNPFTSRATLRFSLAKTGHVDMAIYDVSGRMIKTLADGVMNAGENTLVWDGTNNSGNRVGGGIFWMQLRTHDGYISGKKMIVLS